MDKSYDPGAIEQRWYQFWEDSGYFEPGGGDQPYCIMLPPPNVTGSLHMGHAFQDTIMDTLTRWQRMKGSDTLWQPGTDHAGIATQMVVERQLLAIVAVERVQTGRPTGRIVRLCPNLEVELDFHRQPRRQNRPRRAAGRNLIRPPPLQRKPSIDPLVCFSTTSRHRCQSVKPHRMVHRIQVHEPKRSTGRMPLAQGLPYPCVGRTLDQPTPLSHRREPE